MTCERTILKCSLSELEARQLLRNNLNNTKNIFQSTENSNPISLESFRRPYLSKLERDAANELPEVVLKEYFKAGEFIHVPMTSDEKICIDQFIRFNRRYGQVQGQQEITENDLMTLTEMLIGRRTEDLMNYIEDVSKGIESESILIFTGNCGTEEGSTPIHLIKENNSDWSKTIHKQFSIYESSGSITQIAFRTGFESRNARIMIGACATQEERYNRVGEMVMAYREKPSPHYNALILDGHKRLKSTPNGPVQMRQTVTCIVYDPLTDIFFSGGYDGDVVAWNASKIVALDNIGSHPKPINSIACHASKSVIAYGCQSGGVYYCNSFTDLEKRRAKPITLFTKPKGKDSFSNTVDTVIIPPAGPKSDNCYSGIGFLQSLGAGVIEEWDLETGSFISTSERLPSGLTCMSVSSNGSMLISGTGGVASDEIKGDGIVRIMDLKSDLKTEISIKTEKYDLDCVSFCPRNNLVFIGETSDSSVALYDLRFPSEPLFTTIHGSPNSDSIVAHAWLSKGNILATGGHDGKVKLWDCQRGFSPLNNFEFNSSISCITYSEADHSIWVGTDNGGVYMLAGPGSLGENHPTVISGKCIY